MDPREVEIRPRVVFAKCEDRAKVVILGVILAVILGIGLGVIVGGGPTPKSQPNYPSKQTLTEGGSGIQSGKTK